MEIVLKLYTYVDGVNDTPFPNAEEQAMFTFTYDANRMGGSPQISATVKHRLCLDDLWNDKVYATFRGEKYFIMNTPSSDKDNTDERYNHDIQLLSEREVLNHVYFIDAVQGDSTVDVYKSNSTKVIFFGDVNEFVSRLNACLSYQNLDYTAVLDSGVTSEDKQVSFEDKYILEALQEIFNVYEIPYYFVGKVIHVGFTENTITYPLKYGFDEALLSISKQNANYALINKIKGQGSSDNIPYYYPNESDDREAIEATGKKWITPMTNLMPSIYRESEGAEQFYEAKNNTYEDGEGGYYEFENEYSDTNQRQGTTDFEEIKPTIEGMTNASGQRIDMFSAFAYDTNDNDETDEDGNYIHSYFFAKLRKFDGENGFNLFDHAIESQAMQISFTSGVCGACTFEIGVGEETQKNIVQVDEFGNLKRDDEGNVLWENQSPQDRQNDTRNYEVWIALKKEADTYGIVFPNASQNLKPSTDDTFVILGINLPTAYITAAEKRLEQSLIKYMWMNNTEKFTFSIKFSRIFFTEHPEVLEQLNENSRVLIEYNGQQHTLYVDNFSYKTDDSSPLPEIEIDLVDTLSVGQNSLQTQLDSVKQDILSSIGGGDFLKQGLKYFLRKDVADTAQKKITFREGIDIGAFESDISGGTFRKMQDGSSYAEVDKLKVRVKAYFETLEIQNINSVGGKQIITPGGGVYVTKVQDRETVDGTEVVWDYYRCYFLTQQDGREIENRFKVGDLAISQNFNVKEGVSSQVTNHYYWREVVGVGDDYIDLSKSICDTDSDEPAAEDVICQLGNRTDVDRQGAIIFSAVDEFSPSITLYQGINDFSYVGKDYISYGLDKTTGKSFFRVYGEMYVGDREQNTYIKYTQDNGVEIKGKLVTQTGKDVESTLNSFQDQIDGVKETFYGEYSPTLDNYPANEWTTDAEKERHIGDVFTNIQAYVDDETTPDAGKSWRWMKNDEDGTYYWLQIADSDTSKAYYEAAKANQAAQEAKEQVTELNTTVDGLQNFTDEAFKDGIVDRSEASSISTYLNNIKSIQNSVTESYSKVYNNELLEGTYKTNLLNAYNAFNNATNELTQTIEGAIADGLVDTLEKASVDGKYDTFNTKYGDFIAYINAANKYIQDKINATAKDALDKIGEMSYITDALKQYTTIEGGLIQSSLLALGYTYADEFKVMSGTNGIYNSDKLGGGIASWWGGAMFDRFEYTEETMPSNVATGLVRFDGTGYFANGNLWWEADGTLHADPLSFFVGEDAVGDVLGLFQFVKSEGVSQYVIPQLPFQKLEVANDLRIGKAYLKWDETNNALYVVGEDGSACNFYSLGELSAGGFSDEGGSGGGNLFGIVVNGETYTPENGYITLPDYSTGASILGIKVNSNTYEPVDGYITIPNYPTELAWGAITGKPTTLAGYGITDGVNIRMYNDPPYNELRYFISDITISGHYLIAELMNINSFNWPTNWENISEKPSTLEGYGITDAYTKTESDGKYPLKDGTGANGIWGISLRSHDTRNTITKPNTYNSSLRADFKSNSSENLNDGGDYHGTIHFKPYGSYNDFSGTSTFQLGFTDNYNLWIRGGNNETWNIWYKFLHTGNYTTTTDTRYVKKSGDTMTGTLHFTGNFPQIVTNENLAGGISLGKGMLGWDITAGTYISGTNTGEGQYANIKSDSLYWNNTSKFWHAGNDGSGSGLDADLLDGYNRSTLYLSVQTWLGAIETGEVTITVNGDANTYYPVAITCCDISKRIYSQVSIYRDLGERCASYSGNHSNGTSSMWIVYDYRCTKWDGNGGFIRTMLYSMPYATLCAQTDTDARILGALIVYLRGGGTVYHIASTGGVNRADVCYSTTNLGSSQHSYNVSPITSLGNMGVYNYGNYYLQTNLAGNASSASKLETPRTIWGQSFDGTENVSGDLNNVGNITSTCFSIRGRNTTNPSLKLSNINVPASYFQLTTAGVLSMDYGINSGKNISIVYNTGYVGIGTPNPSYKCHVNGTFYASGAATFGSTLSVAGRLSANGGIYTTDISGNGSALYLGNSNNRSFVYLREDMKSSDGKWSLTKDGTATFASLTVSNASLSSLSVSGSSTFNGKTTHNGGIAGTYETLSSYLTVTGDISTNASQYINGIRVYKDTDGYLCIQGNLKITGNVAAAGEVAAGSSLASASSFLYDVTSFDSYSSTATNRAPTARAVKLIKDKVSSVSSTASSVNTKMNSINTYLSQITSSTTLDQLKTILMNLSNAI